MKNKFAFIGIAIILSIAFSCKEKNDKNAITPDYGSTGNPYPNNQTVTGSTTFTSPATQNTSFVVGDLGWSNPSCASTFSTGLKSVKDQTDVVLTFACAISSGTYAISSSPSCSVSCALTVLNAPNQPAGVVWYGKSGSVIVTTTSTSINANLSGVVCTQKDFNFPQVLISGGVGCTQ